MSHWKQFSLTLITSGLTPPVFLVIVMTVENVINRVSVDVPFVTYFYTALLLLGLILSLFMVLPAFAALSQRGWLNGVTAAAIGAVEGLVPVSVLVFFKTLVDGQPSIEVSLALWLEAATISGAFLGGWVWRHFTPKPDLKTNIF